MGEPELTGRTLSDRYRVDGKLGEGGMATAWLAFDLRLARPVVLKIPLAAMLRDETAAQRFQLEIESLIRLRHPHVVHVLDAGMVDGRPYAVLDYLEGGSLEERLAESGGIQTAAQVLEWLPAIADALDHVHEEGMVHRDVKPGNILFDAKGHPALSDFGIVKALVNNPTGLTMTGQSPGSPRYMAPEVLGGRIGPPYDQYSLAAVAYRCLTGDAPEPLQTHLHLLEHSRGRLPLPAISVLQMALSPAPDARFPDCASFVAALREALHEDVPLAVPEGDGDGGATRTWFLPTPKPAPAARRRGIPVLPLVGALLLAGGGLAAFLLLRGGTGAGNSAVVPPPAAAPTRLDVSDVPAITNRETAEVRGRLVGDPSVGLLLDGRNVRCAPDGTFEFRIDLREGGNRARLTAEDRAGRVLAERTLEIERHSVPPDIRLEPVSPWCRARRIEVAGVVAEDRPGEVTIGGRKVEVLTDGGFRCALDLADGPNRFTIEAVDAAGNRARPVSFEVTPDLEPPAIRLDGDGERFSRTADFVLRGAVEDVAPDSVTVAGEPAALDGGGRFSASVRLPAERNEIVVAARDRAGNEAAPRRVVVHRDEAAPDLALATEPEGPLVRTATVEIRVRMTDAHPAGVNVGGRDAVLGEDGRWGATVDLAEGPNAIEVVGRDRAGNENRATIERVRDSTPPVLDLEPVARDGDRLLVRGTVRDAHPGHVRVNGVRVDLGANGSFVAAVAPSTPEAAVRVEAFDAAGNSSPVAEVVGPPVEKAPEPVPEKPAPPPPPESVRAAIDQLASEDPGVRFVAATSLGRAGHPAAAEPLEIALRDDADAQVRRAAARSLGQIGAWRSIPVLIEALGAGDWLVASDANDALRKITKRDFGWRVDLGDAGRAELLRDAREWWKAHPRPPGE